MIVFSNEGLIVILVVGLIAGWLAGQLVQGHHHRDHWRVHRRLIAAWAPAIAVKTRTSVRWVSRKERVL